MMVGNSVLGVINHIYSKDKYGSYCLVNLWTEHSEGHGDLNYVNGERVFYGRKVRTLFFQKKIFFHKLTLIRYNASSETMFIFSFSYPILGGFFHYDSVVVLPSYISNYLDSLELDEILVEHMQISTLIVLIFNLSNCSLMLIILIDTVIVLLVVLNWLH